MIAADTPLGPLLEDRPELVEVLAGFHAPFAKLASPHARSLMAAHMRVGDAARVAGLAPDALVAALRHATGEATSPACGAAPARPAAAAPRPAALRDLDPARVVTLDVRPDIAHGEEPFGKIMRAVKGLGAGQVLVLRVPFDPVPLYGVLAKRGFSAWSEEHAPRDWSIWFYRDVAPAPASATGATAPAAVPRSTVTVDVRDLAAPLPMVLVLERLDALGPDEQLEVIHARRPMFLYPQLEERGFVHETDEPAPGTVRILIRRGPASR